MPPLHTQLRNRLETAVKQARRTAEAAAKVPRVQFTVGGKVKVLPTLEDISLEMWETRCDALPQRFQKAQRDAAKLIEPKVVYITLPSATIHNKAGLEAWMAQVRKQVQAKLEEGPFGIG